jgi:hypothetical protein
LLEAIFFNYDGGIEANQGNDAGASNNLVGRSKKLGNKMKDERSRSTNATLLLLIIYNMLEGVKE